MFYFFFFLLLTWYLYSGYFIFIVYNSKYKQITFAWYKWCSRWRNMKFSRSKRKVEGQAMQSYSAPSLSCVWLFVTPWRPPGSSVLEIFQARTLEWVVRPSSRESSHVFIQFSSVQLLSHLWLFATPWTAARQASLSLTISRSSLRFIPIELVMPYTHLILCYPLLPLPSIFPSIRVFSSESALHIRWPKYWSLNFSTSPSNEYSGLISFRIDWFDSLAVRGTLQSLLQHHSSKASVSSSALSLFYCPAITSLQEHWKNHRYDYIDLCRWRTK